MPFAVVEKKLRELPEEYLSFANDYIDSLLEKSRKINALKGVFSECANEELRITEKDAWAAAAIKKHNG